MPNVINYRWYTFKFINILKSDNCTKAVKTYNIFL